MPSRTTNTERPVEISEQSGADTANTVADRRPSGLPVLKLTLRLLHGTDIAMGPGKADLLEAIMRTGSITAAGKSMAMSYRRAWLLVDEMNRCFKTPLVATTKGGSHGGGAILTPLGREVLLRYRTMVSASKQVAQAYLFLFEDLMAEVPSAVAGDRDTLSNRDALGETESPAHV